MDVIFLGVNEVGFRVYEWLCDRDSIDVQALLTKPEQFDLIRSIEPDILVSVGFDHLVPKTIFEIPDCGAINLHPAFLPHNRGKSPNVWSIVEDTPAGVTLHYMDAEFDTGDIIARREVEKRPDDTGRDLHRRLEHAQFNLFTDVWPDIESGAVEAKPQPQIDGSYHSVDDFESLCEIDLDEQISAGQFLDRLRALTFEPFDNAYFEVDGERYYLDLDIRPATETGEEQTSGLITSY